MTTTLAFGKDMRPILKLNKFAITNRYLVYPAEEVSENYPCEVPGGQEIVPSEKDFHLDRRYQLPCGVLDSSFMKIQLKEENEPEMEKYSGKLETLHFFTSSNRVFPRKRFEKGMNLSLKN